MGLAILAYAGLCPHCFPNEWGSDNWWGNIPEGEVEEVQDDQDLLKKGLDTVLGSQIQTLLQQALQISRQIARVLQRRQRLSFYSYTDMSVGKVMPRLTHIQLTF